MFQISFRKKRPKMAQRKQIRKKNNRGQWLRFVLSTCIFFIVGGAIIYIFFISPLFRIKNIVVEGDNPILVEEYQSYYNEYFLNKNYFLTSKREISKKIFDDFRVNSFLIEKFLPSTIRIVINQSFPFAKVYFLGGEENYIYSVRGNIYLMPTESFVFLTQPAMGSESLAKLQKDLTVIYDRTNLSIQDQEWQNLFLKISEIIYFTEKSDKFYLEAINLEKQGVDYINIEMLTNCGWEIYASYPGLEDQWQRLILLLKQQEFDKNLSYIDLRHGEVIFYKKKD
ncbi:hypothetical protein J7J60_02770 [bacterium]|nr:hypothetical protein [bacterium]